MRTCPQSREELQNARRKWEATGINRAMRRKSRKAPVTAPVVEEKKKEEVKVS